MDRKKRVWWLSLSLVLLVAGAGNASAGKVLDFFHTSDRGSYSPCHYRFPQLWRLKACLFGVDGMPVSVYPAPVEDVTTQAQGSNAACTPAPTPSSTPAPAKKER